VADFKNRLRLKFVTDGRGDLEKTFGPEDILAYIYAVFHSPTYRERYAEFLKIDFPRAPLTSSQELFRCLVELGRELVALHLMESPLLSEYITRYSVPGDNLVEKGYPKYVPPGEKAPKEMEPLEKGRVYVNKTQYIEGVPPEVWDFHVGGYQVLQKWTGRAGSSPMTI
jgi:predicted helicase